jgi:hypothetical protein
MSSSYYTLSVVTAFIPLILWIWGYMHPPETASSNRHFKQLAKKYSRIYWLSYVWCFLGFFSAMFLFSIYPNSPWVLGVCFGTAVLLPIIFIAFATLRYGLSGFFEFWRFYELKYKINIKSIGSFYITIVGFGFISIYNLTR